MQKGPIPIKTPEEIASMRHAGAVLTATLDYLEREIKAGMSTADLDEMAEKFIRSHKGCLPGFKGMYGFPATLCISVNEEVVHGIPSKERILKEGDIVGVDGGVLYNKLHTDACRTFIIGQTDPETRYFVKVTKEALKRALKVVGPDVHVGDISAVIQATLEKGGATPVVECTGHGVGYDLHEPPEIMNVGRKGTGPLLKAGMVLAIEPIATLGTGRVITAKDGWTVISEDKAISAHFEHTVLVTSKSYEVLAF